MRTAKFYPNGVSQGTVSGKTGGDVGPRGEVAGWSRAAARRNRDFLYSIDYSRCDGLGVAYTLTLKDCPPTPSAFHSLRRRWIERLRYYGALRWHWIIEMQRRGVPHLHAAVYWPESIGQRCTMDALAAWLQVARVYGAGPSGQHFDWISDAVGWAMYLDKHAARGVSHYQRSPQSLPPEWAGSTGRLWGYGGQWPRQEPIDLELSDAGWYRLRRMVRQWVVAHARKVPGSEGKRKRMFAKRMLTCPDPELSPVRGVSEWVPQATATRLLRALEINGEWFDHR